MLTICYNPAPTRAGQSMCTMEKAGVVTKERVKAAINDSLARAALRAAAKPTRSSSRRTARQATAQMTLQQQQSDARFTPTATPMIPEAPREPVPRQDQLHVPDETPRLTSPHASVPATCPVNWGSSLTAERAILRDPLHGHVWPPPPSDAELAIMLDSDEAKELKEFTMWVSRVRFGILKNKGLSLPEDVWDTIVDFGVSPDLPLAPLWCCPRGCGWWTCRGRKAIKGHEKICQWVHPLDAAEDIRLVEAMTSEVEALGNKHLDAPAPKPLSLKTLLHGAGVAPGRLCQTIELLKKQPDFYLPEVLDGLNTHVIQLVTYVTRAASPGAYLAAVTSGCYFGVLGDYFFGGEISISPPSEDFDAAAYDPNSKYAKAIRQIVGMANTRVVREHGWPPDGAKVLDLKALAAAGWTVDCSPSAASPEELVRENQQLEDYLVNPPLDPRPFAVDVLGRFYEADQLARLELPTAELGRLTVTSPAPSPTPAAPAPARRSTRTPPPPPPPRPPSPEFGYSWFWQIWNPARRSVHECVFARLAPGKSKKFDAVALRRRRGTPATRNGSC